MLKEDEIKNEEFLERSLEELETAKHAFCCFVDNFKRFVEKREYLKDSS